MTDDQIYAFCDANKDDIRCKCIYPDKSIVRIGIDTRLPYYCWYEPCKRSDALLPASLKKIYQDVMYLIVPFHWETFPLQIVN